MLVNNECKFRFNNIEDERIHICSIDHAGEDDYYLYDEELEFVVNSLTANEIVCLMFTGRVERQSRITGRINEIIEVIK